MKCNCLLILFIIINKNIKSNQGNKKQDEFSDNIFYPDITDYADINSVKNDF